jgi:hypothetical protein
MEWVEEEAQGYIGKRILESIQAAGCIIYKGTRTKINKGKRTITGGGGMKQKRNGMGR